ncbi:MAG: Gfo/Idh/MocA family oxidoreductase [Ignavibacteria bacterium]|nr:Gfo/Idh/MocA family oxidoreductase [Ignavibacteria bacterium]
MKRLRTAVVGLGRIGWQYHIPAIRRHKGFELIAVVDPLRERLMEAGAQFDVQTYQSLERLFAAGGLDLLVVASPTEFHAEQTLQGFENGCDVFCEKPLAGSMVEASAMIDAMERTGRKLMVYQPHRAGSDILALQDLLRRDLIGTVYMMKRAWSGFDRRTDWQAFRKHGGGMLNNYGAHMIDQLLYLSRSPVRRVSCSLRSVVTRGDADDVVKVVMETSNGMLLDLDITMAAAQALPAWHVLGSRGSAILNEDEGCWRVRFFRDEEVVPPALQQGLAAEQRRYGSGETIPWREEIIPLSGFPPIDFYDRCYDLFALGKPSFVPIEETLEVMRVIDLCREDAERIDP